MNELSIFNVGEHSASLNASMFSQKNQSNLFDPRVKSANDEIVFIVRPMPYVNDVTRSLVSKNFYVMQDEAGYFFYDSMVTFNDKAKGRQEFCPVSDLWLKLNNSPNPATKDIAKQFRMQRATYCYVMIVAFPADPTYVGKMVPMRLPNELRQFFTKIANPSEQDIALGAKPVNPFDLFNGVNIKVTARGKMVNNQLMRDWTVEKHGNAGPAILPLGPNGAWTAISELPQDTVLAYFKEKQAEDLTSSYGYKAPSLDVCKRMYAYMQRAVAGLPELPKIIDGYFPEVVAELANGNQDGTPLPQQHMNTEPIVAQGVDPMQQAINAQPMPQQPAQPMPQQPAQPMPQQPAQPLNDIVLP